jgi:hypothetical protein
MFMRRVLILLSIVCFNSLFVQAQKELEQNENVFATEIAQIDSVAVVDTIQQPVFNLPDDSLKMNAPLQRVVRGNDTMTYNVGGLTLIYPKPKKWSFITQLPGNFMRFTKNSFSSQAIPSLELIGLTTIVTGFADQWLIDNTQQFLQSNGISGKERFEALLSVRLFGKDTRLLKNPLNINTAIYNLGQGGPMLAIGAGLWVWGAIKKDYRAKSTAQQIVQGFLLSGFATQIIKRITGRENPSDASTPGGYWTVFPSPAQYQSNQPKYDAYPSGHMTTLITTMTILAENYPEKKWIKPVGYTFAGLLGLAMMNNGVHWASDYPLAIGLGIGIGKAVAAKNRTVVKRVMSPEMLH